MARRVQGKFVGISLAAVLLAILAVPADALEPGILALYTFDEQELPTGPDTFSVFAFSEGTVRLSTRYRWSGFRSAEIRDVPGDGDFPEIQGYFKPRHKGRVYAQFALLLTNPAEPLNVALAGPQGFSLGKDGIAFWITARGGALAHVSDSIPKRLFVPRPFVWYFFDLVYDVDRGIYHLRVFEEGSEAALIDLRDQPNAASQPGSAIDKYSFIGDRGEDVSKVLYYVDDVVIATEEPIKLAPFVAPGRRSFFVERWGAPPLEPEENPLSPLAHERAADAAFLAGRPGEAIALYERLLEGSERRTILELKLADAYFKAGDREAERRLREAIYGRLEEE